jgi:hypothetical protein
LPAPPKGSPQGSFGGYGGKRYHDPTSNRCRDAADFIEMLRTGNLAEEEGALPST